MASKLEQLKKKQEQLRLQIQKEQQKESTKKRKEDTRRKILLGAMVLERMERESDYKEQVSKTLDKYLTKERDRNLFDLPISTEAKD